MCAVNEADGNILNPATMHGMSATEADLDTDILAQPKMLDLSAASANGKQARLVS